MKIAIVGSLGTGKTTLTGRLYNYLKEKYDMDKSQGSLLAGGISWRQIPESAVQARIAGFIINENTPKEAEWWIVAKQLEMELLTPEPWISDRCLIDILVYTEYLFGDDKGFIEQIETVVKPNINYDLVIYLPSGEFPIEDDGYRSTDPKFQEDIDKMMVRVMKDLKIDYHRIVGNPEERLEAAKKLVDSKLMI